jgi:uncharacterized protein YjbJ (UPF0337 family)
MTCPRMERFGARRVTADEHTESEMDKDRIKGSIDQTKGAVKETIGKTVGDKNLEVEGQIDTTKGKIETVVGDAKDKVRDLRDQ